MSDDDIDFEGEEGGGGKSRKKLIIIIAAAALVLILGGVGAMLLLSGGDPPPAAEGETPEGEAAPGEAGGAGGGQDPVTGAKPVFMEMPDIVVNLNTGGKSAVFLKISLGLELSREEDVEKVNNQMRRIVDDFTVYLREMRQEDLNGSAGIYRLRQALLRRANLSVPSIRDVLFKEIVLQ